MSIILLLIAVANAAANDRGWAFPIRIEFGPVYLNFFMLVLLLGLVAALVPVKPPEGVNRHALFMPTMGLFACGLAAGIIGVAINNPSLTMLHEIGFAMRDYMALPLSVFIGYRLSANGKAFFWFPYIMVAAGVAVSVAVLISFRDATADITASSSINKVRTVAFLVDYAGLACALLLFSITANIKMFPRGVSLILCSFCLIGQAAPLHRSSWVACLIGIMTVYMLVPAGRRGRAVLISLIAVPVLIGAIWLGIYLASVATGWDFYAKMEDRVMTLIPGQSGPNSQGAAWDSRTGAIGVEFGMWLENPVLGLGFGAQEQRGYTVEDGVHHNAWTDLLAKTGIVGLAPYLLVLGGLIKVGIKTMRQATDRSAILIGALATIVGAYYVVLGTATWAFNDLRSGMCAGIMFGLLLRCREYQLMQMPHRVFEEAVYPLEPLAV